MRTLIYLIAFWLSFGHAASAFGQECDSLFSNHAIRAESAKFPSAHTRSHEWENNLVHRGKLIYVEATGHSRGSEFLASNEADWAETPFDHKEADLMVAFGTNSAWELAVDKNVHELVIADWSPYPLLAQAYIVEPLMRISKTPQQFLAALNADQPSVLRPRSVAAALEAEGAMSKFLIPRERVAKFLNYLATRPEITDTDLRFLSEYFWTRTDGHALGLSPFNQVRTPAFLHFAYFYNLRYSDPHTWGQSVFHNPARFAKLRSLYAGGHVRYARTDVASQAFYQTVNQRYSRARSMALSLTNIFSMSYHEHSASSKRLFLRRLFESRGRTPLTVFETSGDRPPHKFMRYDIETPDDVP